MKIILGIAATVLVMSSGAWQPSLTATRLGVPAVAACSTTNAEAAAAPQEAGRCGQAAPTAGQPLPAADPDAPVAPIASNFDTASELVPSWGNGAIPGSMAPDIVGAFRFSCTSGQVKADDPIVWPGQPGKSHLHQFFGNTLADASSTYASLRTKGDSTCMSKLNRSAYWQPAMLDGQGKVVTPVTFGIYYKRFPSSSPLCNGRGNECVAVPPGMKFIFGYDMITGKTPTGSIFWQCTNQRGDTVTNPHSRTMTEALKGCTVGMRLEVRIEAPECWNGTTLDSANHRDHVAYATVQGMAQPVCDRAHPKRIPQFTLAAFWDIKPDADKWTLSSDAMMGARPGETFHADFFAAWDPPTEAKWTANCIEKLLNCSGGDLGNGQQLRGRP